MLLVGVLVLAVLVMGDSDSDEEMHAIAEAQARAIAARQAVVSPRVEPVDAALFEDAALSEMLSGGNMTTTQWHHDVFKRTHVLEMVLCAMCFAQFGGTNVLPFAWCSKICYGSRPYCA